MCGIVVGKRRDNHPVAKAILKRFNKQRQRGTRGFGFAVINKGRLAEVERFETETEMEKALKDRNESYIMFHHRQPTSTPNKKDMAHPIEVENKELESKFIIIHNGVIRNDKELRKVHEALGYKYTTILKETNVVESRSGKQEIITESFNDSEAFAIELARFISGKSESIDAKGTIAFVAFEVDKKDKLIATHYGHNSGNPLKIEDNGDLFFLKSEGDGEALEENVLFTISAETNITTQRNVAIGEFGGFARHKHQSDNRQMGFGAYEDPDIDYGPVDDRGSRYMSNLLDREMPGLLPSPIQRNKDGQLDWGEDPLVDIPTIHLTNDEAAEEAREEYFSSQAYIDDMFVRRDAILDDIKTCKQRISNNQMDDIYHTEYLEELEADLESLDIQLKEAWVEGAISELPDEIKNRK